jgi:glutamate transport system substrate-binding protein
MKLTDIHSTTARRKSLRVKLGAVVAGVVMLAVAGCSGGSGTPAAGAPTFAKGTTMAKIAKEGTFKVGVKFDAPGFSEKTLDGTYQGMDIELSKMVAKALGIPEDKIDFTETISANREPFIQQGKVDMVAASYGIEPDRQKVVDFAGPYVTTSQNMLVTKGNPKHINTWADVAGTRVCAVTGSNNFKDVTANAPTASQVGLGTDAQCAQALKNGQVDMVAGSVGSMGGYVAKDSAAFELSPLTYGAEPIGIGVKKGDKAFCEFIDGVMQKAYDDGSFQKAWDATLRKSTQIEAQKPDFLPCD